MLHRPPERSLPRPAMRAARPGARGLGQLERRGLALGLVLGLAACGGGGSGGGGSATAPAAVGTLAVVVSQCSDPPGRAPGRQALMVRSGDSEPRTVLELDTLTNLEPGYCDFVGRERFGPFFAGGGVFQRL